MTRFTMLLALALVLGTTSLAQDFPVVRTLSGTQPATIPPTLDVIEDLDGDGIEDVLVGYARRANNSQVGEVEILSGATGLPIRPVLKPAGASTLFGGQLRAAGDWDGDGDDDVLVGDTAFGGTGALFVFSSATGAEITRFLGFTAGDAFGAAVDLVGDLDGDGITELLVGSPAADNGAVSGTGRADVISSMTGAALESYFGTSIGENLGTAIAVIDDLDVDGRDEFLIAAPGRPGAPGPDGINHGAGVVFSPTTGSILRVLLNPNGAGTHGGASVARVDDVDGDGFDDTLVSWTGDTAGSVVIFNRNGQPLHLLQGGLGFGLEAGPVGDLNGDGVRDIAVSGLDSSSIFDLEASTTVYSGDDYCPLFTLEDALGFTGGFPPYTFAGIADTNGDGFDEMVHGRGDAFGSVIVTGAGRGLYGSGGAFQTLTLDWTAGAPGAPLEGTLLLSGGAPNTTGALAIAFAPAQVAVGGFDLLVDLTPGAFFADGAPFDGTGAYSVPVSLDAALIAGFPLFLQGFEASAASPNGFAASNGLELQFSRDEAVPVVESVDPAWVPAGGAFQLQTDIRGECFAQGITVLLNGTPLFVVVNSDSRNLTVVGAISNVPLDSTLELINPGGASTVVPYNISPAIDSIFIQPDHFAAGQGIPGVVATIGGTRVTLNGEGFFDGSVVMLAGQAAPIIDRSDIGITFFTPPAPAGNQTIQVLSPNGGQASFTVQVAQQSPVLSFVAPRSAPAGQPVLVRGAYFAAGAALTVGGQVVVPQSVTIGNGAAPDEIVYIQPAGLGCDEIVSVTNPDGAGGSTTINLTPVINSHTPSGPAAGGNLVFLEGPFDTLQDTSVTIDGMVVSSFPMGGPSAGIAFTAPPHAPGVVTITVTNAVGCSASVLYTYL